MVRARLVEMGRRISVVVMAVLAMVLSLPGGHASGTPTVDAEVGPAPSAQPGADPDPTTVESRRMLVTMDPAASDDDKAGALAEMGAVSVEQVAPTVSVVETAEAKVPDVVAQSTADKGVIAVEADLPLWRTEAKTPNDPLYGQQWGLSQTNDVDVNAAEGWSVTTGSPSTVVAVIDTGVDISHPDLAGQIWTNPGEIPGNGIDDDGNGLVDDVNGWDFLNGDNSVFDPASELPCGGSGGGYADAHGTHVAGILGARGDNGVGVSGVAWRVTIMPLKFIGPCGGYTSDAIKAINYAVAKGANVINASWGGTTYSSALKAAIDAAGSAGVLFVAAAGNDGVNIDASPHYPASYTSTNLIAVAAIDSLGQRASYSNYGTASVDVGAPGTSIVSTVPGNAYQYYSGTSMAAPFVSGAAALIDSRTPGQSAAAVRSTILNGVRPSPAMAGVSSSGGVLDVARSLGVTVPPLIQQGTGPSVGMWQGTDNRPHFDLVTLRRDTCGWSLGWTGTGGAGTWDDTWTKQPGCGGLQGAASTAGWTDNAGVPHLEVVVRDSSNGIWWRTRTGQGTSATWTNWTKIGDGSLQFRDNPTVVAWTEGDGTPRIDVFVRRADTCIWHNGARGGTWLNWNLEPGCGGIVSSPAVVQWRDRQNKVRFDVFGRDSSNNIWHRGWVGTESSGGAWSGWSVMGAGAYAFRGDPAAAVWFEADGDLRIDVFQLRPDTCVWHNGWSAGKWNGWNLDPGCGGVTGSPSAVTWRDGDGQVRFDVFANDASNKIWHRNWTGTEAGGSWNDWENLGQ